MLVFENWSLQEIMKEQTDIEEVVRLYQEGLSARKVAEMQGISESAVSRRLKKAGVMRRKNNGKEEVVADKITKERLEELI